MLVTLDSPYTKDVDDAFAYGFDGDIHYITVAIAHASSHVPADSSVDLTARARASTIYSGNHTRAAMLPKDISEGAASLLEGVSRRAMVFRIELDPELSVRRFAPSIEKITVDKRLHYDQIKGILNEPGDPHCQLLRSVTSLAKALLAARRSQGALAFYDLTRMLASSEEGAAILYHDEGDTIGHVLIQELMILTNRLVAQYLLEHDIPALFRNHEPKVSSPPSSELVQSLEAWMAGGVGVEVLEEKVRLVTAKAEYGATALGHYGLTLPAYVHSTSPLRRYPDLVVQRQLTAHLSGRTLPYTHSELGEIARGVNKTLFERQATRSEDFKAVVRQRATRALEKDMFHRLQESELVKAIELTAQTGEMPDGLGEEISERLEAGTLSDKSTFTLLNEAGRVELPPALQKTLKVWLEQNPPRAMSYLHHAQRTEVITELTFTHSARSTGFAVKGSVRRTLRGAEASGVSLLSEAEGPNKKAAEQLCAMRLVFAMLGIMSDAAPRPVAVVSPGTPTAPLPSSGESLPGLSPKNRLLETCQARRWGVPVFTVQQTGPTHAPQFHCTAVLKAGESTVESAPASGTTKKGAEMAAAQSLLQQLEQAGLVQGTPRPGALSSKNAVSLLQEWAQQAGAALPEYAFEGSQDAFSCSVRIAGFDDAFTAQGKSKQEAKQGAAAQALAALGVPTR